MSHLANNTESSLREVESACSELRTLQYWFGFAHFLTQVPIANISIQHEDRHLPSSERSVRSFHLSAASNEFVEGLTNLLKEEHARVAARIAELEARMAAWE